MAVNSEVYLETLAAHGYQPLLRHVTGTMCFEIQQSNDKQQKWHVTINQGEVEVRRDVEDVSNADCIITGPEDELLDIFNGVHSFAAALVRGTITVQGDHTLAQKLRRFSPPAQLTKGPRSDPHDTGGGPGKRHTTQRTPSRHA